jgi:ABC-type lipoprotein release transport system permease subunit
VATGESTSRELLAGPRIRLHVVGVVRSPWLASDGLDSAGKLITSPALTARYRANLVGGGAGAEYVNAIVRLRGGAAAIPAFRQHVAAVTARTDIEVVDLVEQQRQVQRASTFEARCLLAFAGAALIAALFLVGPAVARYSAATAAELDTLHARGMTKRQVVGTAAAAPAVAAAAGGLFGAGVALVASRWFPIGTASFAEPTPGTRADWWVLLPGIGGVLVTVLLLAAGAAWRAAGAATRADSRRSVIAQAAARAGLPTPVVVGSRFALESGRGRAGVPVRPAMLGAAAGVLGIVAAFTFASGVDDAATNPARFGQTFQLLGYLGLASEDFVPPPVAALARSVVVHSPDVQAELDAKLAIATANGGNTSIALYRYAPVRRPLTVVLASGRMPAAANEVVLAPRSAAALHAGTGDSVTLTADRPADLVVTGIGFAPQGPHNTYADGGWLTPSGYDRIFHGFQYHEVLIALRPGVSPTAAAARIRNRLIAANKGFSDFTFDFAATPAQVSQIRQVRVLPVVLGAFLALLALGAVGHALATAVRRRAADFAILRVLGMTRQQTRAVVVTQASVLAVVGLLVGVPVGVAAGRAVWRVVAEGTPVQYAAPIAAATLAIIVPAALFAANLLAAWPAHRAARLRIADVLRAE